MKFAHSFAALLVLFPALSFATPLVSTLVAVSTTSRAETIHLKDARAFGGFQGGNGANKGAAQAQKGGNNAQKGNAASSASSAASAGATAAAGGNANTGSGANANSGDPQSSLSMCYPLFYIT